MIDCFAHDDKQAYAMVLLQDANATHTAWIPVKYAEQGTNIKIRVSDNWLEMAVLKVYPHRRNGSPSPHKAIREHRKRTGDSLPKIR